MNSNIQPNRMRVIGWYALRWAHMTDWFKAYAPRFSRMSRTAAASPPAMAPPFSDQRQTAGRAQQATRQPNKAESEENKLKQVVEESQNILVQTKTVFPFTPFPTKVTIDRHKLTIVYRKFFNIEQTVSVPIEDIKNIQADAGPFLGSLTITSDLFINNIQKVDYLPRHEVKEIQKLVQGAMVALKEGINLSKIDCDRLRRLLRDLGEGHTTEATA